MKKITEGLDNLRERLIEYKNLGSFTKWRAVIKIDTKILCHLMLVYPLMLMH